MRQLYLIFFIAFNLTIQVPVVLNMPIVGSINQDIIKRNDLKKERDNLTRLLKTLHYSCIILARFQISTYGEALIFLLEKFQSENDQDKLWKIIYISHVLKCQRTINYEDSVQIFTLIKANDFDQSLYNYVFLDYSLEQFQNIQPNQKEFSKEDNKTWKHIEVKINIKFYEDFEQSMNDKQKEQNKVNELFTRKQKQKKQDLFQEPEVFGIQLKLSNNASLIIISLIFIGISGIFYKLLKQINNQESKNHKKKKI